MLARRAGPLLSRRRRGVGIETPDPPKTDVIVTGGVGELYISGDPKSIRIYTANGILVSENRKSLQCPAVIYLVIDDGETRKVTVR